MSITYHFPIPNIGESRSPPSVVLAEEDGGEMSPGRHSSGANTTESQGIRLFYLLFLLPTAEFIGPDYSVSVCCNYDVDKFGPPTWKVLEDAIRSPGGGNNAALADKIAKIHPASPSPGIPELYMHRSLTASLSLHRTGTTSCCSSATEDIRYVIMVWLET